MSISRRRLLEIIPGFLVWTTLLISVAFSFVRPLWMVYFIIIFDFYWLMRIMYLIPFQILSWVRYRSALKRNWQAEAEQLPGYDNIRHLIFLPIVKEGPFIARETLEALCKSNYPTNRMIVVLAGEERAEGSFQEVVHAVVPEFEHKFMAFYTTLHPKDAPGDIVGKGSNLHYSGNTVLPKVLALGLLPDNVIASQFDIDAIAHPQYFSCVTFHYLTVPEPTRSSYQPVPLYNNNLWESPAVVRVAMFGTTFWLMTEQARHEGMMTFSSHSTSLRMLMDVGFWQRDVVSDDSRIFLQGLVQYHGAYRVTPIYLPVSMDTVMSGNYWKALVALYKLMRRWAWGVENFPYIVERFLTDEKMSRRMKAWWIFKQLEGSYTWATAPFLIFILGYLPFWLAPEHLRSFAVFQNTPFTLQWIMRIAMLGLFVSATLSLTLLPPRPSHMPRPFAFAIIVFQWILMPVSFILFGAVPALDAITRLMLGKGRIGFWVSPKRTTGQVTIIK